MKLGTLYSREPVMVLAVLQAGLAMLMGFGLHLTADQMALVMAFFAALLGVLARTQVTAVATLPDHIAAAVVIATNSAVQPKIPIPPDPLTERPHVL